MHSKSPRQRATSKPEPGLNVPIKPKEGWTNHWRSVMQMFLLRERDTEAGEGGCLHGVCPLSAKGQPG